MQKIFTTKIIINYMILPIIYSIIGILLFKIIKRIIKKINPHRKLRLIQSQRINTLKDIIINIFKYLIMFIVILSILSLYGINVKAIIAGLGITTALIGLAFQDLAKDIIAGFSIIAEGKYEIGDTIEIDNFMGEVLSLNLRTTKIKNFKGATKIIANHYMDNIINYSLNNSLAVVDIAIAYECNEEIIEKTFNNIFEKLNGKIPYATQDIQLLGLNEMQDSSVIYRIVVETEPMKQFITERFLRKEIKKELDKAKIKIPYQQIEVHNGK